MSWKNYLSALIFEEFEQSDGSATREKEEIENVSLELKDYVFSKENHVLVVTADAFKKQQNKAKSYRYGRLYHQTH